MNEEWRPIVGWETYAEVSDSGRIRTKQRFVDRVDGVRQVVRARERALAINEDGYWQVTLYKTNYGKTYLVHRLLLEAFVGPCPEGMQALHGNGVRTDCRLANLRWGTLSENVLDSVKHGTNKNARKTHCPRGHPYSETNTYITTLKKTGRPRRVCRTCSLERGKREYAQLMRAKQKKD